MMNLRIFRPTDILVEQHVSKITAEAENGCFCLLPRHTNFVTLLVPGILTFTDEDGADRFVGLTSGLLVKTANTVSVSSPHAVLSDNPGELNRIVRRHFESVDERERQAMSAVARLEAHFVRRFLDLESGPHVSI